MDDAPTPGTWLRPVGGYRYLLRVDSTRIERGGLRVQGTTADATGRLHHDGPSTIGPLAPVRPGIWRDARRWPFGRWSCVPRYWRTHTLPGRTGDLFA